LGSYPEPIQTVVCPLDWQFCGQASTQLEIMLPGHDAAPPPPPPQAARNITRRAVDNFKIILYE